MPSAIGGLTPEYRGADIRCGLNERLGCGTLPSLVFLSSLTQHRFALAACLSPRCNSVANAIIQSGQTTSNPNFTFAAPL